MLKRLEEAPYAYDDLFENCRNTREVATQASVAEDWVSPATLVPPPPSSFPWRFLAFMAVVGIGIVLLGVLTYTPSKPGPPDNLLEPGSCVAIEDNGDASEVNCDSDHDGVVESLLAENKRCPPDVEPHRDRQGLGVVCVRFDI